jgi:hypothetical protein
MRAPYLAALAAVSATVAAPPAVAAPAQPAVTAPAACAPDGELRFVCGQKSPEDLVAVPGTRWLVASGMVADGGGLHLIDSRSKATRRLYPDADVAVRRDAKRYPACAEPPPSGSQAHGLSVRTTGPGKATLYVVGHGPREAVEVFTLDSATATPRLSWVGCVLLPAGMAGNSVTSLADGTILATVLFRKGFTPEQSFLGTNTGTVLRWRPGEDRFSPLPGTELPANNGIEVSADGRFFYVAASGSKQVVEFSVKDSSHPLRRAQLSGFAPDNVRFSPGGALLAAGMMDDEPACGGAPKPVNGKLVFTCHRGYGVAVIDTRTMSGKTIATGPRNPSFSGATTALHVGKELWIASLMGDRVAYRPWP